MKTYLRSIGIAVSIAVLGASTTYAYTNSINRQNIIYLDELSGRVIVDAVTVGEIAEDIINNAKPEYYLDGNTNESSNRVSPSIEEFNFCEISVSENVNLLNYFENREERVATVLADIPFEIIEKPVDSLFEGESLVVQEGRNGKAIIHENRTYYKDYLILAVPFKEEIISESISQIVEVGTKSIVVEPVLENEVVVDIIDIDDKISNQDISPTPITTVSNSISDEPNQILIEEIEEVITEIVEETIEDVEVIESIEVEEVNESVIESSSQHTNIVVDEGFISAMNVANVTELPAFKTIEAKVTAYTPYDAGCNGVTYTGTVARKGVVAVDPSVIPLGTKVYVPGYGIAIAEDVGGAIKGDRVDVCFNSVTDALNWGVKYTTVYILLD